MIGVVGPEDSVALVLRVAAEIDLAEQVVARAYQSPQQAPELALDLDPVCEVILFTGRAPYSLARVAGGFTARLEYVPYTGIDLYRAIVYVLRQHAGALPALSIDTIETDVVAEVWRDLGLQPPGKILPLSDGGAEQSVRGAADLLAFHVAAWRSGAVQACLTCFRSVYDSLVADGVTAFRVEHTRASVRDSLTRAFQISQRSRTEAQQIAVGLLESADGAALTHLEDLLHARVQSHDGRTHVLFTTWGALQRLLESHAKRPQVELLPASLRDRVALGFGLGATVPRAEENARRALTLARQDRGPYVVFADGGVRRLDRVRQRSTLSLRSTDPRLLERARQLGMSAVSLQRLAGALQQLNPQAISAQDLADTMGLAQRSARRVLLRLQQHGIAHPRGSDTGPGAGRPRTLYQVDSDRLLAARERHGTP